jgi:hypothetical protein
MTAVGGNGNGVYTWTLVVSQGGVSSNATKLTVAQ